MSEEDELIPVLFNSCHGGFWLSNEITNKYKERTQKDIDPYLASRIDRDLIDICLEVGNDKFNLGTELRVEYIPKKFEKYFTISEYDGCEDVDIDYENYKLDKIKEICNDNSLTDTDKIANIKYIAEDVKIYNWRHKSK